MTEFPAAHSMDTCWFAIDLDGNVAIFETGESGCVPTDAYVDDGYALQEELRALPAHGFAYDPDGYREIQAFDHVEADDLEAAELHVFLSDLVPVRDLLARLDAVEVPARGCKAVRVTVRDRAAFAELHARAACLGCFRDWSGEEADLASHGVYRYEHTCENWIAGPYARATIPTQPLVMDAIPKAIRDHAVTFDGRFADTARLQPAELWPCESWEAGWLSSDGKTARPFEGHEDEWSDYAADRAQDDADGGITFVNEPRTPPAAPKPKKPWWKVW